MRSFLIQPDPRPGYRVHEWVDETSIFDPNGSWSFGSECNEVFYRIYVPIRLKQENVSEWIDRHADRSDFWIPSDHSKCNCGHEARSHVFPQGKTPTFSILGKCSLFDIADDSGQIDYKKCECQKFNRPSEKTRSSYA